LADEPIPLTIGGVPPRQETGEVALRGDLSAPLGRGVAQTLLYLIAVLDREDRLESGTGELLAGFRAPGSLSRQAVSEGVLRALGMAADPTNFRILESLSASGSVATGALAAAAGLGALPLGLRVGDLVSAGLASKLPETNQVAATAAGNALVGLVHQAVTEGAKAFEEEMP